MHSNETWVRNYLGRYGSDVESWPEEYRSFGRELRASPAYRRLFSCDAAIEVLLAGRPFDEPSGTLAERIIQQAALRKVNDNEMFWLPLLGGTPPFKRTALAAMLALGFAIGYGTSIPAAPPHGPASLQIMAYDEGATL